MKRIVLIIYVATLSLLWFGSWIGFWLAWPWLAVVGCIVTTSAPLLFFISQQGLTGARDAPHPIGISAMGGLGAVMVMAAIYRFGDQYMPLMCAPLLSLGGWMLYLKLVPESGLERLD